MPRPPVLGYLQSAIADNTAHSQMDKLLFEDEMSNIQPEWGTMSEYQEGYDPAKAISEGDFMPVGAGVKLFRGVPKWYRKQMVKGGKYLSPIISSPGKKKGIWASNQKNFAEQFAKRISAFEGHGGKGVVLEFDVPKEWIRKTQSPLGTFPRDFYRGGIPKEYLKKVHKGYQHGGPAERAPLLGYMNPAIQDAHSQINRIMFENEERNKLNPAWGTMRTYQQGYDPAREWGEGMMPIGGAMKLLKGSKEWPDLLKVMAQSSRRDRYKMEAINNARNIFGKKIDAGGADAATKQYLESKWMEQVIQ
jgi:hypothetical protein